MGPAWNAPNTGKLENWDPGGTSTAPNHLRTELRPPICRLEGMPGRPTVGKGLMGMGIWWKNDRTGVPRFLGPRDGSNRENSTGDREISAARCQIRA